MSDQHTNEDYPNKDLGTQGQEDTLKGKMKQATGKVQSGLGHALGDKETEAKGDTKQAGGKVQSAFGKGEQKVDNALNPDKTDDTSNNY